VDDSAAGLLRKRSRLMDGRHRHVMAIASSI
jgi:hypothetical protein